MKQPSYIYTIFHTLKAKDSPELYVILFPGGIFIGRPQISFVLITTCYTTDWVNHKDFKTVLQHSAVTWTESRPMYKVSKPKQAPPVLGTNRCKEIQHFLKTVTDFLSIVSLPEPCCNSVSQSLSVTEEPWQEHGRHHCRHNTVSFLWQPKNRVPSSWRLCPTSTLKGTICLTHIRYMGKKLCNMCYLWRGINHLIV